MVPDPEASLNDEATFAGAAKRRPAAEMSLGDERTLGDGRSGQDAVIDDIEIVDLEARYRVEGTLGQGGMGAVLLATDTRLDRKVAIKRILGEAAGNRMAVQRFLTEAKSIAALNHPNIVQIYDYGRAKDGPFLIMEFVDGGSLLDRCREHAIPLDETIDLACQLCDGLAKAHDLGIIHRDIKPANVLLTKDGLPKLTDFGLAKAQASDHGQTMTGAVLGTPDFMPPEQRRDASFVDHRSDIWSLAATLYQMVTGRSPKIVRFDLLPSELTKVLGKALEDAKESRFQTARELRDALKSIGNFANQVPLLATSIAGELQEGQCKACGTVTSDLTKKFCRSPQCGASLRVACLQCDAQIPVWDGVCGECGGNQPALLEASRAAFQAKRMEAESLLAEFAFDEAIGLANEVAGRSRIDFADLAEWASGFVAEATAERDRRRLAAKEHMQDARMHAAAYDYSAAIHAIEAIPNSLRASDDLLLLADCRSRQHESTQLIEEIGSHIKRKEFDGLLPIVERAAQLRGDRTDLAKIRQQLADRRDLRLTRARAAMAAGDVKAAAAALAGAVVDDLGPDGGQLLEQVRRAVELEGKLAAVVKDAKADGVVNAAEAAEILRIAVAYLEVNPSSQKVRSLVEQCEGIIPPQFTNSVGIKLKLIPTGTFTMGDVTGGTDERPHQVMLTKAFYIGVYEVTNAQWKRVVGRVPSMWQEDDHPVERVSWDDAIQFCRNLSALPEERKAGRVYRLPTEAEWEYACRAGTTTKYSFGDDEMLLGEYGWFDKNSGSETHPVGQKKPNDWGLYDMHGNVWEWCSDRYSDYSSDPVSNPEGPSEGSARIRRGGGWDDGAGYCRSANRNGFEPSYSIRNLGFRLALSPPEGQPVPSTTSGAEAQTKLVPKKFWLWKNL